jgi:hypothetical protein
MLSVIKLNAVLLNVVAPTEELIADQQKVKQILSNTRAKKHFLKQPL